MHKGSCLCQKVKYQISGKIEDIVYCHCSQCRKAQGSAFAVNGLVNTNEFKFLSGKDYLTKYRWSEKGYKHFCKLCGSPIMSTMIEVPHKIRIRLGSLDNDCNEPFSRHIFASSKANWDNINDDLPQFDDFGKPS